MQLLGSLDCGVVSLASSAANETGFVSLADDGSISVWDTRLKQKNYAKINNPNHRAASEASEVLFVGERGLAVALCGFTLQLFDVRRQMGLVAEYEHPTELVRMLAGAHPAAADTTLVVDEDGAMIPVDLTSGTPSERVPAAIFGQEWVLPSKEGFGALSNYCSVCSMVAAAPGPSPARALLAVGMDGTGCLYTSPERATAVSLLNGPDMRGSQVVNPPLVNCGACCGNRVAIGRANGEYTVLEVEDGKLAELMSAPGHASNGLVFVEWTPAGDLLTISLCGEITVWGIHDFLASEEDEDAWPEVRVALAHRGDTGSRSAVINCGFTLAPNKFVVGDADGRVAEFSTEVEEAGETLA